MQSKHKYIIALLFLIFSIVSDSYAQQQKCKVNIHSMKCIYSDDYGKNEELYGRIWALNLKTYGTVEYALNYFNRKELIKIGDGSGAVLDISRISYIQLKKNQSHVWYDMSKELTVKPNDKIIVIGELIDRDWNNPDDKLMSAGSVWYKVVDLAKLNGALYQVDLSFKNSQSKVNMLVYVK
ncbi:MAG: hypothetical protein WBP08_10525 [Saprospiraceae bacterium]